MKNVRDIIIVLAVVAVVFVVFTRPREVVKYEHTTDTIVIRDTIVKRVPQPYRVEVVRTDTVFIPMPGADTVKTVIPIERKEYRDEDYYAVIEGFRPELVSMTVYPKTKYITDTKERTVTKRPWWGVGIQAGYGYAPTINKPVPYIGIGIQYNLFSW